MEKVVLCKKSSLVLGSPPIDFLLWLGMGVVPELEP
jgi:hypothetical protein